MAETKAAPLNERAQTDVSTTHAQFHVRADGPTSLMEVVGEVDLSNADAFAECLSGFQPGDAVIVDLARMSFVDSQGIATLVQACSRGVKVTCRNAQDSVRRVLDLCGVGPMLNLE